MLPLITVVIPVYKVEKYLARCIESVLLQTYTQLEIILVDDGSPDRCPEICDEYAAKDGRIKVIHKENGGLSSARNAGIDAAEGEYIAFIDSDDLINSSMISELYNALSDNDADISACGYKNVYEGEAVNTSESCKSGDIRILSGIEAVKTLFGSNRTYSVISCNKLYKLKLFKDIRFPVGKIHEDEFTTYRLYFNCERVVFLDGCMYYYLQRDMSITHTGKITTYHIAEVYAEYKSYCTENIKDITLREELLGLGLVQTADLLLDAYYLSARMKLSEEMVRYKSLYLGISPELSRKSLKKLKFRLFDISPALFRLAFRVNVMLHGKEMSHFR